MSDEIRSWPIIESLEDADAHDHELPALVPVPGHLVRPLLILTEKLYALDCFGQLARGIEMQLIGLAEHDASCVLMGLHDAMNAAAQSMDRPAVEAEDADGEDVRAETASSKSCLRVIARDETSRTVEGMHSAV